MIPLVGITMLFADFITPVIIVVLAILVAGWILYCALSGNR